MSYTTHTEDFIQELYTRMDILSPNLLDFQLIAKQLGIRVFYWPDKSQALFKGASIHIFK